MTSDPGRTHGNNVTHNYLLCEAFIGFLCLLLALVPLSSQACMVSGLMTVLLTSV
jgi:hypothetical protein